MTTKENNLSNRLIAEFMGYPTKNFWWHHPTPEIPNGLPMSLTEDICKFHSSWDWLIVVINKIYDMDIYFEYKNETCSPFSEGGIEINTKSIERTWESVVEFIKWYNENKTTLPK